MRILGRKIVSDGTHIYMARGKGLYKVAADGTNTTLSTDREYVALTYGNSVLYGANAHGVYSIHVTTGVATFIMARRDIEDICYYDTDTMFILAANVLLSMVIAQDTAAGTAVLGTITEGTAVLGTICEASVTRDGTTVGSITVDVAGDYGEYGVAPTVSFTGGSGTGAAATATIDATGAVTAIAVTAAGTGYTSDPTVVLTDPEATVIRVTITAAGDYGADGSAPEVSFTGGGGADAAATATIDATGAVTVIAMTDLGSSYETVPTAVFTDPEATIVTITITDAGQGYQSAPAITFTGENGIDLEATCTINASGQVTVVTIVDPGSSYESIPTVVFAAAPVAGTTNPVWNKA